MRSYYFFLQNEIIVKNETFRREEGIVQADMTLTLPEFPDTDLDIENTLQNQLCVHKIVQERQATLPGLS